MWLLSFTADATASDPQGSQVWFPLCDHSAARLALARLETSPEAYARSLTALARRDAAFCCWLLTRTTAYIRDTDQVIMSWPLRIADFVERFAESRDFPLTAVRGVSRRKLREFAKTAGRANARVVARAELASRLGKRSSHTDRKNIAETARLLAMADSRSEWIQLGEQLRRSSPSPEQAAPSEDATSAVEEQSWLAAFRARISFAAHDNSTEQGEQSDTATKPLSQIDAALEVVQQATNLLAVEKDALTKRQRRMVKPSRKAGKRAKQIWKSFCRVPSGYWQEFVRKLLAINPAAPADLHFPTDLEIEKLESLAEFAAGAGHEINNPIAVISGRASLLARGEADPKRRRDLAVIKAQADRVYEMIAAMMFFARPPQPEIAEFDLAEVINKLLAEIAEIAELRQIELATEGIWRAIPLQADAVQVAAALKAVYDNALFAIGQDGRIVTSVVEDEAASTVRVIIRDTGAGITPEVRRHLFDPYFSGRQSGRGLGMGLSKAWRIIHQHAGTIEVESNSGEDGYGATFVITLPALASSAT